VLFGGPRGGKVIIKVDPEKTGSPQMAMGIQYLEAGIPVHRHEHEEEFLFVHTGEGIGILGDERVPLPAGSTMYIPPGTWHGIEHSGDSEASQIMWVVTPGSGETTQLDKFFRETRAPAGEELKTFTPEQFEEILRKHGQVPKVP
jgi:mannose-6-phosphate isomerase-like protein (cupin superfamily)